VPVAAAVKDPGPVFTAVGVEAFTGREWLVREVDRFIAANPSGYVFVEAEAGLGKTAFAAWLVKTRGCLSHFSRYADGRSVRGALRNLSAQLVIRCKLDEQVPGGMLPDWSQAPAGLRPCQDWLRPGPGRAGTACCWLWTGSMNLSRPSMDCRSASRPCCPMVFM
jgi:hypothetical protein